MADTMNVEQFGRRVSEQLLPELESLFTSVETHLCTVEARLIQLEGRVKLLERICARLMTMVAVLREALEMRCST